MTESMGRREPTPTEMQNLLRCHAEAGTKYDAAFARYQAECAKQMQIIADKFLPAKNIHRNDKARTETWNTKHFRTITPREKHYKDNVILGLAQQQVESGKADYVRVNGLDSEKDRIFAAYEVNGGRIGVNLTVKKGEKTNLRKVRQMVDRELAVRRELALVKVEKAWAKTLDIPGE